LIIRQLSLFVVIVYIKSATSATFIATSSYVLAFRKNYILSLSLPFISIQMLAGYDVTLKGELLTMNQSSYGSWISKTMMQFLWATTAIFLTFSLLFIYLFPVEILAAATVRAWNALWRKISSCKGKRTGLTATQRIEYYKYQIQRSGTCVSSRF
jgi:hypothetical protein